MLKKQMAVFKTGLKEPNRDKKGKWQVANLGTMADANQRLKVPI